MPRTNLNIKDTHFKNEKEEGRRRKGKKIPPH
jgi:hypothetical protein